MKVGKGQGTAILILGVILLAGGILVLVSVPSWGNWIANYPVKVATMSFPPQAAPIVQGMGGVFGPLLQQVGGYIRAAGYFIGSLLTIISICVCIAGTMVIRTTKIPS
jgi:hypothetical protein